MLTRIILLFAALLIGTVPLRAEGLVDNVNGLSFASDGAVVRFVGFTVTPDGRVGRLLQRGDKRPERPAWRLDGKGRTLLPGFVDAHGHVMGTGLAALTLDLSSTTSLAAAQVAIADYARRHGERRWLIGGGWNQEAWGLGRYPTAAEIDAVAADKPVVLTRIDGHALWANRAAMAVAGVTARTADPKGGRIERLPDGSPSGVFVDTAMALIERVVPPPLPREREAALMRAQDLLLAQGVTTITDMGTTADDWNALRRLGDRGALVVRVISYADTIETALSVTGGGPTAWLYDDRLRMVGVKFYADGALGSRGACLKADYADAPGQRGLCLLDDAKLRNLLSRAAFNDLQPAIHAIGDAANAQVLGAIEELAQTYKGDRRWRIEHAQVVDPGDLGRFAATDIIASVQPVHQTSDRLMAEARLGPARLAGAYAWGSLLAKRTRLAFGTDVPVERPNPFAGLAAAITREDATGAPFGGWQPQERIGREAALTAYTVGSAYAARAEDRLGRIAPGTRADFILVDTDPLMSTPAQLRATKVLETFINGVRVWRAGASR